MNVGVSDETAFRELSIARVAGDKLPREPKGAPESPAR